MRHRIYWNAANREHRSGPFSREGTTTGGDRLWRIKILHTAIWVVFVGATFAIPVLTSMGDLRLAVC
jgi:hypothetical protein